jgi:hypothetical protein
LPKVLIHACGLLAGHTKRQNIFQGKAANEEQVLIDCGAQHSNSHLLNMAPPEKDFHGTLYSSI